MIETFAINNNDILREIAIKHQLRSFAIEGFHVMSYQANFASHLTLDCHVDFLSPQSGIGKYNQMTQIFLFSSYYTKLQRSDKNISAHTRLKF